jgi:hypothetical protein
MPEGVAERAKETDSTRGNPSDSRKGCDYMSPKFERVPKIRAISDVSGCGDRHFAVSCT